MKKILLSFVLIFFEVSILTAQVITFDDQGHTNGQNFGITYGIMNNGETFNFSLPNGGSTNLTYRTTDGLGCSNTGHSHLTASGFIVTPSLAFQTMSGNEFNLGTIKFDNVYACFSFSYNLIIEGFKNGASTGTQSFTVSGMNATFSSNANFNDVDRIVITSTGGDIANLGIDNINWIAVVPAVVAPTVSTTAASVIANASATLAGNVTADGGATVTERGIVYSTSDTTPTITEGATKDTNSTGTGTFSESITGLAAGTQYYFNAYAINSEGTSYGAAATFTTTGKGWTGATDTNWLTATNWSPNSKPISTDNLVIPNVANKPIIGAGSSGVANNITIDASSSLTISANSNLTISGNLTQNGTLTINSDDTSNGSLIVNGISTGNVSYDRYVSTSATAALGWHLLSSPVSNKNITNFFGDVVINGNKRGIATYVNTNGANLKWDYYTATDTPGNFIKGKGYSVKKTTAGSLTFNGTLNTDFVDIDVIATGDNYNAIGNPFTSYINSGTFLDDVTTGRLTEKTIWLWDESGNGGVGEYIAKNTANAYKVAPVQAFFVQVLATGNVRFNETTQTHIGGNTFLRQENKPEIKLSIKAGANTKNTEIFYIENKTTGWDDGYDSSMFGGVPNSFAVYTQLVSDNQGKNLAIQSLPNINHENMIVPVGVNVEADIEVIFSLNAANFSSVMKIFLEDRETNTFTRLDEVNSIYKVTLTKNLNGIGRFYIHTTNSALNIDKYLTLENISIYKLNSSILRITGLQQGKFSVKLFTILGKQVLNTTFNSNGVKDISLPQLASGVYVINLQTEKGKLKKRIILE